MQSYSSQLVNALQYETNLQRQCFQVDRAVLITELQKALDNTRLELTAKER